tara:strand:- start:67 stop:240 length:174 start_codon:yes stop_codon:yes gene_type:complete
LLPGVFEKLIVAQMVYHSDILLGLEKQGPLRFQFCQCPAFFLLEYFLIFEQVLAIRM